MSDESPRPNRRSLRYPGYDYTTAGAYFVTFCAHNGQMLLGHVEHQEMQLIDAGRVVAECWFCLPDRYPDSALGAFQVMPNHVHGILWLQAFGRSPGAASSAPTLGKIMRAFKSLSAREVNRCLQRTGSVWQRGYYDRNIRDDTELERIAV